MALLQAADESPVFVFSHFLNWFAIHVVSAQSAPLYGESGDGEYCQRQDSAIFENRIE
jgi:hypothetical protein